MEPNLTEEGVAGVLNRAIEVVAAITEPLEAGSARVYVLPAGAGGFRTEIVDLEPYAVGPGRQRGELTVSALASFIASVNRWQSSGTYVEASRSGRMVAVLNGHDQHNGPTAGAAGWGDHKITLSRPLDRSWIDWTSLDRKSISQLAFAEFVEDHLLDIVQPDSADLLEIVTAFTATKTVSVSSAKNLTNGQTQIQYVEDLEGKGPSKSVEIPTRFVISLRPFADVEPFEIAARLRWRLREHELSFSFLLDTKAIEDQLTAIVATAIFEVEKETSVPVFEVA